MDFHTLSRKELQALCKKNKIPANMTNIAMADALAALQRVEGLDEFFKPVQTDAQQLQEEKLAGTPRTTCRTSTRRKPVREEPESSKVSTRLRNGTRAGNSEKTDQENKDLNVPVTPAMPNSGRRETAVSTRTKKETHMPEDENGVREKATDVPKTPAAPSSRVRAAARSTCRKLETSDGTALQRGYNTRRSVRLLEKNLADMSLIDNEDQGPSKMDEISEESSDISQQTGGLVEMEKGASSNMISAMDSEKCDELEVSTEENNMEYECQSKHSKEKMQMHSEVATDAGANLQVEPEEESFNENSSYQCEPHCSNSKTDISSEKYDESSEVLECCEVEADLNKSIVSKEEKQLYSEVATGSEANLQAEPQEESFEENNSYKCEPHVSNSKEDISSYDESREILERCDELEVCLNKSIENELDVNNKSISDQSKEVLGCCDELEVDLNKSIGKEVDVNNLLINTGHELSYENKDCLHTKHDALSVDAPDAASVELTEKDIAGFLAMSSANNELGECNSSNQVQENEHLHEANGNNMSYSELSSGINLENSVAIQAYNESSVEDNMPVENITVSFPLVNKEEEQKDSSNNLELKAGPETTLFPINMDECKDRSVEEKIVLDVTVVYPCIADGKDDSSLQILVPDQEVSVTSGVTTEEISTPILESLHPTDEITEQIMEPKSPSIHLSIGVMDEATHLPTTVAPTYEQKTREIPIQLNSSDQLNAPYPFPVHPESKETANGNPVHPKMGEDKKVYKMEENLNTDELNDKSMRQLRKMLKNLSLDGKTKKSNNAAKKEVGKIRTALQALPDNRMSAVESQKDS